MPPSNPTRSRIPVSPCPVARSGSGGCVGGSFVTSTRSEPSAAVATVTSTAAPGAWRRALLSASWTSRYAASSMAGSAARAIDVSRTGTPARRLVSTRVGRSVRPGCGAVRSVPTSPRSTVKSRRICSSESLAASAISANSAAVAGGTSASRYGALSARTVTTDIPCATTSCISRAIRACSSSTPRRSRSVRSPGRASALPRTTSPPARAIADRIAGTSSPSQLARSGAIVSRTPPTSSPAAQPGTNNRRGTPTAATTSTARYAGRLPTSHGHGSAGVTGSAASAASTMVASDSTQASTGRRSTTANGAARNRLSARAVPSVT